MIFNGNTKIVDYERIPASPTGTGATLNLSVSSRYDVVKIEEKGTMPNGEILIKGRVYGDKVFQRGDACILRTFGGKSFWVQIKNMRVDGFLDNMAKKGQYVEMILDGELGVNDFDVQDELSVIKGCVRIDKKLSADVYGITVLCGKIEKGDVLNYSSDIDDAFRFIIKKIFLYGTGTPYQIKIEQDLSSEKYPNAGDELFVYYGEDKKK
ncbi:MAG: hypothetical protein K6E91_06230 [Butyrivibrio sp.]|nr:hypothetical protein [Butyrivibrio sp.]